MGFDVSSLTDYVSQDKLKLISKAILGGRTMKIVNLQTGVKGKVGINILDVDPIIYKSGTAGFTASGTTTLTQRTLDVQGLKSNLDWNIDDLVSTYQSENLKPGAIGTDIPFEEDLANGIAEKISERIDNLIWDGYTDAGLRSGQKTLFNGLLQHIEAESGSVITASTRSNYTGSSTCVKAVDDLVAAFLNDNDAVNDAMADDLTLFVSFEDYNTLKTAYIDANLYHVEVKEMAPYTFKLPRHENITCVAVRGLNGTDIGVLTRASNIYIGVDMEEDLEKFIFWEADDKETVRFLFKASVGVNFAFMERIAVIGIQPE